MAGIGIVADDLTGAADALAPFRARGYECDLLLTPGSTRAEVVATVTHGRAVDDDTARERANAAVRDVIEAGRRPYLKIDSTMRGPVAAHLDGALAACREAYGDAGAIVCPAYPELGRTVEDGVVFVDCVPLGESVFTADPRNPVRLSAMADLLPGAGRFDPAARRDDRPEIAVADATEPAHLDAIAELALADPAALLVGSAGLAAAWARRLAQRPHADPAREAPEHVLLVASSRHPVTLTQIEHLPDDLISVFRDDVDRRGLSPVTVLAAPARFSRHEADQVLSDLARRARSFVESEETQQLVLIGGDGAAAVLAALDARAISLREARMPGHAEGVIRGGIADGVSVITRAGGFGTATTLSELLRRTLAR